MSLPLLYCSGAAPERQPLPEKKFWHFAPPNFSSSQKINAPPPPARGVLFFGSGFDSPGNEVLLDHQRHLEGNGIIELPQVQAGELLDLLQPVHQGVAVDEQLPGSLGHVQVVFKELVDGEQSLLVQSVDGVLLKDLLEEHLAQDGGQLIDQPADAQVLIVDDRLLGVEHLAHVDGHAGLLIGPGQVPDVVDHGADADDHLDAQFLVHRGEICLAIF